MTASLLALTTLLAWSLTGTCDQPGVCPVPPVHLAGDHGGMGGGGGGMGGTTGGMGTAGGGMSGGGMSRGGAMGDPLDRLAWPNDPMSDRARAPGKAAEQGPQCVTRSSRCTFPASSEVATGKPCHCAGTAELGHFE